MTTAILRAAAETIIAFLTALGIWSLMHAGASAPPNVAPPAPQAPHVAPMRTCPPWTCPDQHTWTL